MGLYAAHTLGDGNCASADYISGISLLMSKTGLFRALSDQYYGTPNRHALIRSQVCDFLFEHAPQYELFVGSDPDDSISASDAFKRHVDSMRTLGTYGSHLEIQAWAKLTGRKINIIQPGLVYVVDDADENPRATSSTSSSEDEAELSARELRFRKREALKKASGARVPLTTKGKAKEKRAAAPITELQEVEGDDPLYIVYHDWEHYSSARNIDGPHAGPPRVTEVSDALLFFSLHCDVDRIAPSDIQIWSLRLPARLARTPTRSMRRRRSS
jgi:hypothetical protein